MVGIFDPAWELLPPWTKELYLCTVAPLPQSTYIYRAPQCMSPRWNWDSPTPLAASEYALPPGAKGGGAHSPAAKEVGESQFQRLEKRLALCLLCALYLLSDLLAPSQTKCTVYTDSVLLWGGGMGVLNCAVDHILQEFYTLFLTRFRIYNIASASQTNDQ
jgi:hypothetical protein